MAALLGQLSDLLDEHASRVMIVAGLCAPIVGLMLSGLVRRRPPSGGWACAIVGFYVLAAPLAAMTFGASHRGLALFPLLLLTPFGLLLGLYATFAGSRAPPPEAPGLHCAKCGYDLRATPLRCPECGTAVRRVRE